MENISEEDQETIREFLVESDENLSQLDQDLVELEKRPKDAALKGSKSTYFREAGGVVEAPLYLGLQLEYGNKIEGPAVIVEPTTTIAIQPGYLAEVTKLGNYMVNRKNGRT